MATHVNYSAPSQYIHCVYSLVFYCVIRSDSGVLNDMTLMNLDG